MSSTRKDSRLSRGVALVGALLASVAIGRAAPSFEAGPDATIYANYSSFASFSRLGIAISEPGADHWAVTVDFGDGSGQTLDVGQGRQAFDLTHYFFFANTAATYTVTVTVRDDAGGFRTDTFDVTVRLNCPPTANAGPPQTVEASGPQGAQVILDGTASSDDDLPAPPTLTYTWTWLPNASADGPTPTVTLPLGTTTVTLIVSDGQYRGMASVDITVRDTTPPLLTPPGPVTATQTSRDGAAVGLGQATATDLGGDALATITNDAPDVFPLGDTLVTWTATDGSGNAATATQRVTVVDSAPPVLTLPPDITVEQTTRDGERVLVGTATATDVCDAAPSVTASVDVPEVFPLGATAIPWAATDVSGNAATATQTVKVQDTTPPVILRGSSLPGKPLYVVADLYRQPDTPVFAYDIGANPFSLPFDMAIGVPANGNGGAMGIAIDSDSGVLFMTYEYTSTIRLFSLADGGVGTAQAPPNTWNLAGIAYHRAKHQVYAIERGTNRLYVYNWDAAARTLTLAGAQPVFLDGVTYGCGLALDEFNGWLLVADAASATVRYFRTADFSPGFPCAAAGSFPVSQPPTGIAVDAQNGLVYTGNAGLSLLTKHDMETGREKSVDIRDVTGRPTDNVIGLAVDEDTGLLYVTTGYETNNGQEKGHGQPGGELLVFNLNLTLLCNAGPLDEPTGLCVGGGSPWPDTPPAEATSPAGAPVQLEARSVADICDAAPTLASTAPTSGLFPLGPTIVIWTATDASGNVSRARQRVRVVDTTPPTLTVPAEITVARPKHGGMPATDARIAAFLAAATAADLCDPAPAITHDAPPVFPLGTTLVVFTARDASGNTSSGTSTVTVTEAGKGRGPRIESLWAAPAMLWPPNHRMVAVTVGAVFADHPGPEPTYRIVAVTSNEPVCGEPDWVITGDHTISLRAERRGTGHGRIYTITVEARDAQGNVTTGTATVGVVSHDQRK